MQSDDLAAPTRPLTAVPTALAWQLAALLILRGTQNDAKVQALTAVCHPPCGRLHVYNVSFHFLK